MNKKALKQFIAPSIGRVVWYWPGQCDVEMPGGMTVIDKAQPFTASVALVQSDRMVTLSVADHRGITWFREGIQLVQGDGKDPELLRGQPYAEWMPYQQQQAAKAEAKSTRAPHQQRVVDEKSELDERMTKLDGFFETAIYRSLDLAEQTRLVDQRGAMQRYSNILGDRIAAF